MIAAEPPATDPINPLWRELVPAARRLRAPLPNAPVWKVSTPDLSRRPDLDVLVESGEVLP